MKTVKRSIFVCCVALLITSTAIAVLVQRILYFPRGQ